MNAARSLELLPACEPAAHCPGEPCLTVTLDLPDGTRRVFLLPARCRLLAELPDSRPRGRAHLTLMK